MWGSTHDGQRKRWPYLADRRKSCPGSSHSISPTRYSSLSSGGGCGGGRVALRRTRPRQRPYSSWGAARRPSGRAAQKEHAAQKTARWATSGRQSKCGTYLLTRGVGDAASESFHASRKSVSTAGPGAGGPSTTSRILASKSASAGKAAMPTGANGGPASIRASRKCASTAGPSTRGPSASSRIPASKAASAGKAAMPLQVSNAWIRKKFRRILDPYVLFVTLVCAEYPGGAHFH